MAGLYPSLQLTQSFVETKAIAWRAAQKPIVLEIGFGSGEHLIGQAQRTPDAMFFGAEPFIDGMAKALGNIDALGLKNIRLYRGDVRDILTFLPENFLEQVYILFPDPWPKTRHHKRRLVNGAFIETLCQKCQNGARIRFATDVKDYANTAMVSFLNHPQIKWPAQKQDDWLSAPEDHIKTRYETKRLGDINPVYYDFTVAK